MAADVGDIAGTRWRWSPEKVSVKLCDFTQQTVTTGNGPLRAKVLRTPPLPIRVPDGQHTHETAGWAWQSEGGLQPRRLRLEWPHSSKMDIRASSETGHCHLEYLDLARDLEEGCPPCLPACPWGPS